MSHPKVSIIIPTFNGSRYLTQTIDSVLNQTFKNFEVIVVDDGSTENISTILSSYSKQINYIYKKRTGPAATRNAGIILSKGEYVALLDHDDIWLPEKLEIEVEFLNNNPQCGLVYTYPRLIDSEGKIIEHEPPSHFPCGSVFIDFLKRNRITTFSATMIRKKVFDSLGFLDERKEVMTCDDYDMWLRITDFFEIQFSPKRTVYYRLHDNNLVKDFDQNFSAHLTIFKKAISTCDSIKKIPKTQLKKIISEHLFEQYNTFAFKYYYKQKRYKKARTLFLKTILLKPFIFRNWFYLFLCLIPEEGLNIIRRIKSKYEQKVFLRG